MTSAAVQTSKLGVGARLLLAFMAISGFALFAAGVGIHFFREIGGRLEAMDAHVPAALVALEVSRRAERIIAAAPALLAATDRDDRDRVRAELQAEMAGLNARLTVLRPDGSQAIERIVGRVAANLGALEDLVVHRLEAREQVKSSLRAAFQTSDETSRLLSPWLMVIDAQMARLLENVGRATREAADDATARDLATAIRQGRPTEAAKQRFSAAADTLAEVATTDQEPRLPVLAFRLDRELAGLEALAAGLDPKLRTGFEAQVGRLRTLSRSLLEARRQELRLVAEGEKLLSENRGLSADLATAVGQLADAANGEIDRTTQEALVLQRTSTQLMGAAVVLSLLTSALIGWLYVGRSIVRRLNGLSRGMLAIAGGRLDAPVMTAGGDEIAAMARAVEVFRRNAIELEGLLEERKRSAAQLEQMVVERTRELEQRSAVLRVTFDNMGHGVVMFDRDLRMVAWNRRFQEMLDLPEERLGHMTSFEGFIRYLAERGEYGPSQDIEREVRRHLASVGASYVDERTRPDGRILDIRRNPVPGGGFVSIYADVTEQRRAQALVELARSRLTDAIESLSDGFALWDRDDRLVVFNSRCRQLLDSEDIFVVGTRFEDYIRAFSRSGRYDRSQAESEGWIRERLAFHRRPPSDFEIRLASGLWLHVREFGTQEGGTVTTWTDITNVKRREQDLETARDAAGRAYRDLKAAQASLVHAEKMASLGQLTAGIAHEIKNPLNFVNNFAALSSELVEELKQTVDTLLAKPDEEKRAELQDTMDLLTGNLTKIEEHGRRADGIVKSMLAHSRGGTGAWQTSNLNAIVEEALSLAYHGARAQDQSFNVVLERDFDGALKPIDVVPQDVTRVFLNLFGNGFYALGQRQRDNGANGYRPTLLVSTRDLGEAVEVRVRDNGIGIAPEARDKLFQPFFTTKPTGEGTGLGLSISYDIVTQQHGGSIEVESEVGRFTEFTVRLPRARRTASGG